MVSKTDEPKPDFDKWDFGHLIKECNRCGHREIMDKDVEDGVSLYLPTTSKHELRLTCENCGVSMRMFWVKSDKVKPPKEPDEVKESEVIEEKRKRKKIKKDALTKDSKEEKSVSSDSKGS
jgi:hypothetical protein